MSNALILERVEKIINRIDMQEKPLSNSELLHICQCLGEILSGDVKAHLPHEIAETALNILIRRKYAAQLLAANNPALVCAEALKLFAFRFSTENWRSREQNLPQQFSTPSAVAYLLAYLLNLSSTDEVLEPSAGTGSLAVQASGLGARTNVNEIDERRREVFALLDFNLTACNAEFIHD